MEIAAYCEIHSRIGRIMGSMQIEVSKSLLGVACDGGARENLKAMIDGKLCVGVDISKGHLHDIRWWTNEVGKDNYAGLIVGTSESEQGRWVEGIARRAAALKRKPIFIVEDYPGNFLPLEEAPTVELAVESDAVHNWLNLRKPHLRPKIVVWPTPRYDKYRCQQAILRKASGEGMRNPPVVLWAGQPDSGANFASLRPLLPALKALGVRIHFKAHPKDIGYLKDYHSMFDSAGIEFLDHTSLTVNQAMEQKPNLVITQYSSVAVEAGFYGIPSLHILFADVASAALLEMKGYTEPFWVRAGAAASLKDARDGYAILKRLLYDDAYRTSIIDIFDGYFCSHTGSARELAARWLEMATFLTISSGD